MRTTSLCSPMDLLSATRNIAEVSHPPTTSKCLGSRRWISSSRCPRLSRGAATLASVDGKVTAVRPAPAGGSYVFVNSEEHYVPRGIEVTAKPGDAVYAGDVLSDGIPNPSELVQYKGIGEGRRYFIDKYRDP